MIPETKIIILKKQIRSRLLFFIVSLVLSGVTAFPIQWQLSIAHTLIDQWNLNNLFTQWIEHVHEGVTHTYDRFGFMAYGTDWLAFAHLVIAAAFIGPLKDPVKNVWVIQFGMIACGGVIPLALIAGSIRGIPFFWQLLDCSFGLIGGLLLFLLYRKIRQLERMFQAGQLMVRRTPEQ
jgi:hypothetical protein